MRARGFFLPTLPRAGRTRGRRRAIPALVAVTIVCVVLTECDTAAGHASVENECGETLSILIEEARAPNSHGYTGAGAAEYRERVAAGSSTEFALMAAAGGFVIDLAPDCSPYGKWYSLRDPDRSFALSKDTRTCPR